MNEELVDRESEALLPRSVDGLIEPILAALRRRDGETLKRLAEEAADAARQARAQFVLKGTTSDVPSRTLGALEVLESITSKAAARHDRNAELETARLAGARALMIALGQAKEGYLTPTEAARQVQMKGPNLTRLVARLREVGLVDESQIPSQDADARRRPVRLTDAGRRVLDRLDPGWELLGLYEADAEGNEEFGDELQEVTKHNASLSLPGESLSRSNWDNYFSTVTERVRAALAENMEASAEPAESRTPPDENLILEVNRRNQRHFYNIKVETRSLGASEQNKVIDRLHSLTPRELQVLKLTAQGPINKQIAGRLGTAEHTVKVHRSSLMRKMQAGSVTELVHQYAQGAGTPIPSNSASGNQLARISKGGTARNAGKALRTGRVLTRA
jgi:DNA-binding CsgD family transcriptional regulator/DNA-binding MarR family transcriptional regulator